MTKNEKLEFEEYKYISPADRALAEAATDGVPAVLEQFLDSFIEDVWVSGFGKGFYEGSQRRPMLPDVRQKNAAVRAVQSFATLDKQAIHALANLGEKRLAEAINAWAKQVGGQHFSGKVFDLTTEKGRQGFELAMWGTGDRE